MYDLMNTDTKEKITITSLEVAEMVGKEHKNIIRDIRTYVAELGKLKIEPTNFFVESEYLDKQNKKQPCYDITKKGCEFIAHKLTGIKGTEFTAKYINRFHDMEDYIQKEDRNIIVQGVSIVKFIADDLNVNTASRILMYENYCNDVGIPTGFLPKYEHNGSREMKAATHLLKENNCGISTLKFNSLMIEHRLLEERERASSSGKTKKYKALTNDGLKYGENAVNPHNQKEVQPLYYADTFMELYNMITM